MKKNELRKSNYLLRKLTKFLLIMKLTALLILVASTQISAKVFSQDAKISLHLKDANLSKLFSAIEKKTDFRFVYSNNILPPDKRVSIDVTNTPLSTVLMTALLNTSLTYSSLENKLIIISQKNSVVQFRKITGKVTDEKGNPLIGVTVKVVGSSQATTTDADGNYSIELSGDEQLEFSYVGFNSQTVTTEGKTTINLVMIANVSSLTDVVVVGYGTQKKINLTGAISTIKYDETLENRPITNASQALSGQVPGMWISQNSGAPGSDAAQIRVRGWGTLNNSNPLVLIDGTEGSINEINPNDIESMTILKDAASSAIYGPKAANGVILITLKS